MLKTSVLGPQWFLAVCSNSLKCRSSIYIELKWAALVGPRPDIALLVTWARLYNVVRWFYRSRAGAQQGTWPSLAGVLGAGQVLSRKLTCSFELVWHVVPVWCMEFSALGIENRCIFLSPLHTVKKSRAVFKQLLQNYHCYSGSIDLVRSWTGAVWTCISYSDRINNLIILVGIHTSFLDYIPFVECWEEEWSCDDDSIAAGSGWCQYLIRGSLIIP